MKFISSDLTSILVRCAIVHAPDQKTARATEHVFRSKQSDNACYLALCRVE